MLFLVTGKVFLPRKIPGKGRKNIFLVKEIISLGRKIISLVKETIFLGRKIISLGRKVFKKVRKIIFLGRSEPDQWVSKAVFGTKNTKKPFFLPDRLVSVQKKTAWVREDVNALGRCCKCFMV